MKRLGYGLCWDMSGLMGGGRFYDSLEEAMRALKDFEAALLKQGFEVAPIDDEDPLFLAGFRAWKFGGWSYRVWLEVIPREG